LKFAGNFPNEDDSQQNERLEDGPSRASALLHPGKATFHLAITEAGSGDQAYLKNRLITPAA
jgi:hypothetical protein